MALRRRDSVQGSFEKGGTSLAARTAFGRGFGADAGQPFVQQRMKKGYFLAGRHLEESGGDVVVEHGQTPRNGDVVAACHLEALKRKGFIESEPGKVRALHVTGRLWHNRLW